MNLLDKYISEVGQHLPVKNRLDIEAEIRSTLQDMLDDRSREAGQPIDEAMISAVLKAYGAPAKVAAAYKPTPYLIGPRLYPTFELVVKIALAGLGVAALVLLVISLVTNPSGPEFSVAIEKFADLIFGGAFSVFGNIVLVFAILERVMRNADFEKKEKEWDPADLAKLPDPDTVKPIELILTVVFTVIWLSIVNLEAHKLGLDFVNNGQTVFIPALSSAFFRYLPWINLFGIVQIVFSLFLLSQTLWQTGTRLVSIGIKVAEIALAVVMLTGPSLIAISLETLAGTPLAGKVDWLVWSFNLSFTITLIVIILVDSLEIARAIYKLFTHRTSLAFPVVK